MFVHVINALLESQNKGKNTGVSLKQIELTDNGLRMNMAAHSGIPFLNGDFFLLLRIEETTPDRTILHLEMEEGRFISHLVNPGLRFLPDTIIAFMVSRFGIGGISWNDHHFIVDHQPLIQRWVPQGEEHVEEDGAPRP